MKSFILLLGFCWMCGLACAQSPAKITGRDFVDFSFSTPTSAVDFQIRNIGGREAKDFAGSYVIRFYDDRNQFTLGHGTLRHKILVPLSIRARFVPGKHAFPLSPVELSEIQQGSGEMRVVGSFSYDDGTGRIIRKPFCYSYTFPKGIGDCREKPAKFSQ